jgi:hypothetical protein
MAVAPFKYGDTAATQLPQFRFVFKRSVVMEAPSSQVE